MLIDPGSELTFASGQLIKTLQIPRRHASVPIKGIRGSQSERTRGVVPLTLHSVYSLQSIKVTAYILKNLTTSLSSIATTEHSWPHLHGLQLADPDFLTLGTIDLILGADSYGLFIQPDIIKRSEEEPIAQRTIFGWIVLGPISAPSASAHSSHHVAMDHELHDLLTKFWIQEEVPSFSTTQLNLDEEKCETHFKDTHSLDSAGRYVVRLPLKLPYRQANWGSREQLLNVACNAYYGAFQSDLSESVLIIHSGIRRASAHSQGSLVHSRTITGVPSSSPWSP
ncbi:uncharacterized protein [Polyergus mexicanus]|uniref:uncharacterized protein n=1 Tax=Polyergus mexicanus TaxID=615972 RepID=UPI0038B453DA